MGHFNLNLFSWRHGVMASWRSCALMFIFTMISACSNDSWNNPHSTRVATQNVYFSSFTERPKTLDPAKSYSSNEGVFTGQIYEPPLQYHYLLRPYELIPGTATAIPQVRYLDKHDKPLPPHAKPEDIAYSVYEITIKPGIMYQPHPAFAKDTQGHYRYHHLQANDLKHIKKLADFKYKGTRELIAADYVYQIKRLADPHINSPIFGLMSNYIVGFEDYNKRLQKLQGYINLNQYNFPGVEVVNKYTYRIKLKGRYQQFLFWLAMSFFAPMPWEADLFYSQAGMSGNNITLDWYPVGTGPYQLTVNNPNREMILEKNPNFHGETYPTEGEAKDKKNGLLADAGKPLPFIDKFVFSLEKESIPRWTKFLQGYYDQSGISSDNFDQAIRIEKGGQAVLSEQMLSHNLKLKMSVDPSINYMGFNMLDDVVGGSSERAKKLRQAIAIAMNYEDFISIFLNGRGVIAQGPIPPGIFGYESGQLGINPNVYIWKNGKTYRRPLEEAKKLMAEAGYPNGRDVKTGKPLILYFDTPSGSGPDDRAHFQWLEKQFASIDIQLQIRPTEYNRFQEKMRTGNAQLFLWGWIADYPDPENFLFLLYSKNGKVKYGGENAANYSNPQFDRLFEQMKNLPNTPERLQLIHQLVTIVQNDAPWIFGFYPQNFQLSQQWVFNYKPNPIALNTLKFLRIDPKLRAMKWKAWNRPVLWPIILLVLAMIIVIVPVIVRYWQKEHYHVLLK